MTRKQLQSLISAGVFSAALLSGMAYADDSNAQPANTGSQQAPSQNSNQQVDSAPADKDTSSQLDNANAKQQDAKQTSKTDKDSAQMGCSKANGCGGH